MQDIYTGQNDTRNVQRRVDFLCWQFLMHRKWVWIRKLLVKVMAQQGVTGDPGYAETQWSHGSTQHRFFFCTRGYSTDLSPSSYACGSCDWPLRCKCGCKQKYRSWSQGLQEELVVKLPYCYHRSVKRHWRRLTTLGTFRQEHKPWTWYLILIAL